MESYRSHNLGCRVGKFLGSALAAKFVGQNWKTDRQLALMNTKGLMELIVLNID
jgi:hypothetical protein